MRLLEAIIYAFRERGWPGKLTLAVVAAAVPFLGYFIIKGWEYEISVRVRHGTANKLPGWGNIASKLARGVLLRLTGILYNVPVIITLVAALWTWFGVLARYFRQDVRSLSLLGEMLAEGAGWRLSLLALAGLLALAANILYWSGYLRYIETNRYLDFFDVVTNARLAFRNVWDDLLMAVFMAVLGLVAGGLGSLATAALASTGVGVVVVPVAVPAFTLSFLSLVSGHLYGQLAIRTLGPSRACLTRGSSSGV